MKQRELLSMAFHNLVVRKLRTALNLVGIVLSCVLLLCTLAATTGIAAALERFVEKSESALQMVIFPDYDRTVPVPDEAARVEGDMSDRRKERIKKRLQSQWRSANLERDQFISESKIKLFRTLDGIRDVAPTIHVGCGVRLGNITASDQRRNDSSISSVSYLDRNLATRIIAGKMLSADQPQGILVNEYLAYKLGYRSDSELDNLVGQEITLQFRKAQHLYSVLGEFYLKKDFETQSRLLGAIDHILSGGSLDSLDPKSLKAAVDFAKERKIQKEKKAEAESKRPQFVEKNFTVVGIFRRRDEEDPVQFFSNYLGRGSRSLLTHYSTLEPYRDKWDFSGYMSAEIYFDDISRLSELLDRLRKESVQPVSVAGQLEMIHRGVERSKYTVLAIVVIILFISAIGITNTMIISLIERTEEIGIMKAIGASNRNVLAMVIYEGFLTGVIGGLVTLGISFLIAWAGNWALLAYVEYRTRIDLDTQLFTITPWMVGVTMLVSTVVTTLAGIWPGFRASRLDPVVAMGR